MVIIVESAKHQRHAKVSEEKGRNLAAAACGIEQMALDEPEQYERGEAAYRSEVFVVGLVRGVDIRWKWDINEPVKRRAILFQPSPIPDEMETR